MRLKPTEKDVKIRVDKENKIDLRLARTDVLEIEKRGKNYVLRVRSWITDCIFIMLDKSEWTITPEILKTILENKKLRKLND